MEGFEKLEQLEKLYLERNRISKLEGLQNCRNLKELILSNQSHMAYEFTFDDYSLAGISGSLTTLDLSYCRVSSVK
jgi:protein phosphatase 1 regulatory subunit 42